MVVPFSHWRIYLSFLGSELLETWHYFRHGMLSQRDGKPFLCLRPGLLSFLGVVKKVILGPPECLT